MRLLSLQVPNTIMVGFKGRSQLGFSSDGKTHDGLGWLDADKGVVFVTRPDGRKVVVGFGAGCSAVVDPEQPEPKTVK